MPPKAIPILCALSTAVFWGFYGPALSLARHPTNPSAWSSFKPYLFIGIAYLVWACLGGAGAMKLFGDDFSFSGDASRAAKWGFLGGSLGAFGALTLTMALMKAKGETHLVMPIVFGGAVTVSAIANYWMMADRSQVTWKLWAGIAIVAVGILTVTINAPHAGPSKAKSPAPPNAAPVDGAK